MLLKKSSKHIKFCSIWTQKNMFFCPNFKKSRKLGSFALQDGRYFKFFNKIWSYSGLRLSTLLLL